jgi:DNA invertase Pin-like site-specific DNA recombinase
MPGDGSSTFARSLTHLVKALADFDALGINFISLHESVDTSTPSGRLIFAIFAGLSEFERSLIRERVISGQASARRRGVRFGRPRVSVDAGAIKDLRLQGKSFPEIAKQLGLSVGTVFSHRKADRRSLEQPTSTQRQPEPTGEYK